MFENQLEITIKMDLQNLKQLFLILDNSRYFVTSLLCNNN